MAGLEGGGQEPASPLDWREGLPLLVTSRVVLRELRRSDATPLWRVAQLPDVARHAWPAPATVDGFESFITYAWRERANGKYACFAVVPRDRTEPAGVFELRSLQRGFFRTELGLLLDPPLWGGGAFEDGMRLVSEFCFMTVGVQRIEIRTSVSNAPCNAALERMGVRQEALLRSAFVHQGRFEDEYLWALVKGIDRLPGARA